MRARLMELAIQADAQRYAMCNEFINDLKRTLKRNEINTKDFTHLRNLALSGQKSKAMKLLSEKRGY